MDQRVTATALRGVAEIEDGADIAEGGAAALAITAPLLAAHNRRLFRLARSILGNADEAEDVVQDAYVQALSHLPALREEKSLGAWLSRITVNEALAHLRRRRAEIPLSVISERPPDTLVEATILLSPFGRRNPEDGMVQREVRALVEQAIDTLPAHFRTVLVACDVEGMSAAEAADALGLYQVTVKTRLFRARRLLRQRLDGELIIALSSAFACAGARCERITAGVLARLARLRRSQQFSAETEGDDR
jgi:RNA polymerase sigma-70 factor (ECF subfamily)